MPAQSTMIDLQVRKRLLTMQADLHRGLLKAEAANLRAQWSWVSEVGQKARSLNPWVSVGAAALGLVAAWRGRRLARWVPVALAAWRWVQKLREAKPAGG
jgi:hypothetical protein